MVLNVAKAGTQHGINCLTATAVSQVSVRALIDLGFDSLIKVRIAEFKHQGKAVFPDSNETVFVMGKRF